MFVCVGRCVCVDVDGCVCVHCVGRYVCGCVWVCVCVYSVGGPEISLKLPNSYTIEKYEIGNKN